MVLSDARESQREAPARARRLNELLHLLRIYQSVLHIRPLEMGNTEFLAMLQRSSRVLGESLSRFEEPEIGAILELLRRQNPNNAPTVSGQVVGAIDALLVASPNPANDTVYLRGPIPPLDERYDRITVIFGPAIGLGDEITFYSFLKRVRDRHIRGSMQVFSLYPGLWSLLLPGVREFHYRGRPLRPFTSLDAPVTNGSRSTRELVIVADFEFFNLIGTTIRQRHNRDVLEVSLGRQTAWYRRGGSDWVWMHSLDSAAILNHYVILGALADRLLPGSSPEYWSPAKPPGRVRSRSVRSNRRILINPLSSKPVPLAPSDWGRILRRIRSQIPSAISLEMGVYPGLHEASRRYALDVCSELSGPGMAAELLDARGRPLLNPLNTIQRIAQFCREADLAITLDTFTAHLAPLLGLRTLVIAYRENREFWVTSPLAVYYQPEQLDVYLAAAARRVLLRHPLAVDSQGGHAVRQLVTCTQKAAQHGPEWAELSGILKALAEVLGGMDPTSPQAGEGRAWLKRWSRLATAFRHDPVDPGLLRSYALRWEQTEFFKLTALGDDSDGAARRDLREAVTPR